MDREGETEKHGSRDGQRGRDKRQTEKHGSRDGQRRRDRQRNTVTEVDREGETDKKNTVAEMDREGETDRKTL